MNLYEIFCFAHDAIVAGSVYFHECWIGETPEEAINRALKGHNPYKEKKAVQFIVREICHVDPPEKPGRIRVLGSQVRPGPKTNPVPVSHASKEKNTVAMKRPRGRPRKY